MTNEFKAKHLTILFLPHNCWLECTAPSLVVLLGTSTHAMKYMHKLNNIIKDKNCKNQNTVFTSIHAPSLINTPKTFPHQIINKPPIYTFLTILLVFSDFLAQEFIVYAHQSMAVFCIMHYNKTKTSFTGL